MLQGMVRTTLRLKNSIKKQAEKKALEEGTTLQTIFNQALEDYLQKETRAAARKIVFRTHDLGEPLDNLKRSDFYADPNSS